MKIAHIDSLHYPFLLCGRKYVAGKTLSLMAPQQASNKQLLKQLDARVCKTCLMNAKSKAAK